MTKSRRFLRNLINVGLSLCLPLSLTFGCTSSTKPTYQKAEIAQAIENICKDEYQLQLKAKLVDSTLWIYLPLKELLVKADNPPKEIVRFSLELNAAKFKGKTISLSYLIKSIPEQEKINELKYNKDALEKINKAWQVVRRITFSMAPSEKELQFIYFVAADIKTIYKSFGSDCGIEISQLTYYPDLKKLFYGFISVTEYQHRSVQNTTLYQPQEIIGDKTGRHLKYADIAFEDFIARQIQQRIDLKFQKREVQSNADIDKEVLKLATYTLKIYVVKNFESLELHNLLSGNRTLLNQAAVLQSPSESTY